MYERYRTPCVSIVYILNLSASLEQVVNENTAWCLYFHSVLLLENLVFLERLSRWWRLGFLCFNAYFYLNFWWGEKTVIFLTKLAFMYWLAKNEEFYLLVKAMIWRNLHSNTNSFSFSLFLSSRHDQNIIVALFPVSSQ